jgi:hypothetical protein
LWMHNVQELLESNSIKALHVMCTINALSLCSLTEFLDHLLELKAEYGKERVSFTLNILRFPSFQSPLVLSKSLRKTYELILSTWIGRNRDNELLHEHEINHALRLRDYLATVESPHSEAFEMPKLLNDFKQFYTQYDQRRNKNFTETFPLLADWYNTL